MTGPHESADSSSSNPEQHRDDQSRESLDHNAADDSSANTQGIQRNTQSRQQTRSAQLIQGLKWGGVTTSLLVLAVLGLRASLQSLRQQILRTTDPGSATTEVLALSPLAPELESSAGLFSRVEDQPVTFPLEKTTVQAQISGNISRVEVTQTFSNPFQSPLEAIYQFPLPDEAAVDDMEIRIGDQIIRGLIKERKEAQILYQQAKEQGKTAGLLEQERPNIFTQSLANIQPGEAIDVVIRYTDSLEFEGGEYEYIFPTLIGPRYSPGEPVGSFGTPLLGSAVRADSTHQIPQPTVDISVTIEAGVPIQKVYSPSHEIAFTEEPSGIKVISNTVTPTQDWILRYQISSAETQSTVLTQLDQKGGHFGVYLIPALDYPAEQIVPKDVVFLVDTSGSQSGYPIEQSKELMRQFINGLNPEDTFSILDFANTAQALAPEPLTNTPENRDQALAYIEALEANGGTELMNGLDAVLNFPTAPEGRLRSIVLLTDGQIGADEFVIGQVDQRLQPATRLYTFGVGSSTNRFLINRLAEIGRGTSEIVPPNEPAQDVVEEFFQTINNPILTDLELIWIGEGEQPEIYPQPLPDLFAEDPLVVFGRKADGLNGEIQIRGTAAGGGTYSQTLPVRFHQVTGNTAIAQLWGRAQIKALMNQTYGGETPELVEAVTTTALDYRLLSKYTAFVAITEVEQVPSDPNIPGASSEPFELAMATNPTVSTSSSSSTSVPEPSQILGNLLALMMVLAFIFRKRCLGFWSSISRKRQ